MIVRECVRLIAFAVLIGVGALTASAKEALVQRGDIVAVIADSITEQKQYSVFIEDYLLMCQPAEVANRSVWLGR